MVRLAFAFTGGGGGVEGGGKGKGGKGGLRAGATELPPIEGRALQADRHRA